jgi:hypothetical protein
MAGNDTRVDRHHEREIMSRAEWTFLGSLEAPPDREDEYEMVTS